MPVKITQEPPKPEDVRYTLSGITGNQRSRLYWALVRYHENANTSAACKREDQDLLQELWYSNSENKEDNK